MPPNIDPEVGCIIPSPGDWPVDPQEDVEIADERLWIDGCFDFFHHGHAGVMLQSRRLGSQLLVGLHSDEDIAANKGPTVMNLAERVAAVDACRFSTKVVPHAPYVTSLPWISHYGCRYVTHGDDVTSDASGEDCYRFVKKAGRMKIVPRTPGISTTDLVGRMLGCTKDHFVKSLTDCLDGKEGVQGGGVEEEWKREGESMRRRMREYAAAANGRDEYVPVYAYGTGTGKVNGNKTSHTETGTFLSLVSGHGLRPGQRIIYIPGAFDLFSSGHIAFLQTVTGLEEQRGRDNGWYTEEAKQQRLRSHGQDYGPMYIIVGLYDDEVVNHHKGINYPIMNIYERGLCVIQCRFVHAVVFSAPYTSTTPYLTSLPACDSGKLLEAVYHGPNPSTSSLASNSDPFAEARHQGIYIETPSHDFQDVNAAQIVSRILAKREEYEERQRRKGAKGVGEGALRRAEMEKEAEGLRGKISR
ncbi:choline phosphate cytidylyltransferase [Recurvomyces mirabilis]|nr:choline phosphate cytidylyltransferase [Recurvomyces mirabilis]